ncbi:unnamed protein product, partial [Ilex paraguariensis]
KGLMKSSSPRFIQRLATPGTKPKSKVIVPETYANNLNPLQETLHLHLPQLFPPPHITLPLEKDGSSLDKPTSSHRQETNVDLKVPKPPDPNHEQTVLPPIRTINLNNNNVGQIFQLEEEDIWLTLVKRVFLAIERFLLRRMSTFSLAVTVRADPPLETQRREVMRTTGINPTLLSFFLNMSSIKKLS